jgi:thioesterase domain-containing protein
MLQKLIVPETSHGNRVHEAAVPSPTDRLEILQAGIGPARIVDVALSFVRTYLGSRVPPEISLTFLKCDGFFPPPISIRPFPELAADFAAHLERVHPGEPLVLVGYSMSGLIALELAHQLGRPGDLEVVLVEPPLPGILPTRAKPRRVARADRSAKSKPAYKPPSRFERMFHKFGSRFWNRAYYVALQLFLRPFLERRIARGRSIPTRFRSWWYFLPQIHKHTMAYKPPAYEGRVHLVGRSGWLESNAPSWRVLVESGELVTCVLPDGNDHHDLREMPTAAVWIDLVLRLVAERSTSDRPGAAGEVTSPTS